MRIYVGASLIISLGNLLGGCAAFETVTGPVNWERIDFSALPLKKTPNQYLVCPTDERLCRSDRSFTCQPKPKPGGPVGYVVSPIFNVTKNQLRVHWRNIVLATPRVATIRSSANGNQEEFESRSRIFGFPDRITVRYLCAKEEKSTMAIYSRSHYGITDFGVNEDRITNWLNKLANDLKARSR